MSRVTSTTVEFDHAVWDTFKPKTGADIDIDKEALTNLLRPADTAFAQSDGHFFDTIDGQFVFGFESNSQSRGGSERYFDLFVAPVDAVRNVELVDLRGKLRNLKAPEYTADIDGSVSVEVTLRPDAGDDGEFDFSDSDDPDAETPDDEAIEPGDVGVGLVDEDIARTWEYFRRDGVQLYASLREVDDFVGLVDGALEHVSYVSEERKPVSYFDVVDETPSGDGVEADGAVAELVAALRERGDLTWAALPTYEDELDATRTTHRNALSSPTAYLDTVEDAVEDLKCKVQTEVEDHGTDAEALYEGVYEGEIPDEETADDDGIFAPVTAWFRRNLREPILQMLSIVKNLVKLFSVPFAWLWATVLSLVVARSLTLQQSLLVSNAVFAAGVVSASVGLLATSVFEDGDDALLSTAIPFVWLATALLVVLTAQLPVLRRLVIAVLLVLVTLLLPTLAAGRVSRVPEEFGTAGLVLLVLPVAWLAATWTFVVTSQEYSTAGVLSGIAVVLALLGVGILVARSTSEPDDEGPDVGPLIQGSDPEVDPHVVGPEVVVAVDERMQARVETLVDDVESDLEEWFEDEMVATIETESGELARQIVENVSDAKTSFAHEQVHGED